MSLLNQLTSLLKRDKGQGLVEYALILCLVCILVGGAVYVFGEYIGVVYFYLIDMIAGWCGC